MSPVDLIGRRDRAPAMAAARLREVVAAHPTSVGVLAVRHGQRQHGVTVGTFTTVSLSSALVSVCLHQDSATLELVETGTRFGFSLLSAGQADIARWFASDERRRWANEFGQVPHTPGRITGAPLVSGAAAVFECRAESIMPAGSHRLVLATVLGASAGAAPPLLHLQGRLVPVAPNPTGHCSENHNSEKGQRSDA